MKALFLILLLSSCEPGQGQGDRMVGGRCEGCEAALEYGSRKLISVDTLPGFLKQGEPLIVRGTVYQKDGKSPAEGTIVYFYHTDETGIYPTKGDEQGWGTRHGYLRGWIKTGADGRFAFYTNRPASYPNSRNPQHIHLTVKEPGLSPYYIDDILFEDDPLLTDAVKKATGKRGGNGVVNPILKDDIWQVTRDIILGQNIPGY